MTNTERIIEIGKKARAEAKLKERLFGPNKKPDAICISKNLYDNSNMPYKVVGVELLVHVSTLFGLVLYTSEYLKGDEYIIGTQAEFDEYGSILYRA
jgi:hypothetical protein